MPSRSHPNRPHSSRRRVTAGEAKSAPRNPRPIAERLRSAVARRRPLLDGGCQALRLANGDADALPGLVIDKVAGVCIAQLYEDHLECDPDALCPPIADLAEHLGVAAVYRKWFPKDRSAALDHLQALHSDPQPWIGQPVSEEFTVIEGGLRFLVRPYDGYACGLFLEHRENRARVRRTAAGRRVLNAFAYTCGFGVAAAVGGAAETVNVDASRRYLEWGRRNYQANDCAENAWFIAADVLDYLRRARRQGRSFEIIVLDPPTFGRTKRPRRTFSITDDLDRLVSAAVGLLTPGGELLLATNHRQTSRRRLRAALEAAAADRAIEALDQPALPLDFAGDPHFSKSVWARFT